MQIDLHLNNTTICCNIYESRLIYDEKRVTFFPQHTIYFVHVDLGIEQGSYNGELEYFVL